MNFINNNEIPFRSVQRKRSTSGIIVPFDFKLKFRGFFCFFFWRNVNPFPVTSRNGLAKWDTKIPKGNSGYDLVCTICYLSSAEAQKGARDWRESKPHKSPR